jgi:hypothetical protein
VIGNSSDLAAYLLDEHNVASVPGVAFGDDACQRLSYAMSMKNIEKGIDRIYDIFAIEKEFRSVDRMIADYAGTIAPFRGSSREFISRYGGYLAEDSGKVEPELLLEPGKTHRQFTPEAALVHLAYQGHQGFQLSRKLVAAAGEKIVSASCGKFNPFAHSAPLALSVPKILSLVVILSAM